MDSGDIKDFSEENNEDNSHQAPMDKQEDQDQIANSEEVEYEYVDEDGNPISEEEMKDYEVTDEEEVEYVDEEGNPIPENELEDTEEIDDKEDIEYVDEEGNPIPENELEDTEEIDEDPLQPEPIIEPIPVIEQPKFIEQPEHSIIESQPEIEVQEPIQQEPEPIIEPPPVIEQPTFEDNFPQNSQTESEKEEILEDIRDISGISMEELQENPKQPEIEVQEPIQQEPEPIIEPPPVIEQSEVIEQPEHSIIESQPEIEVQEPIEEKTPEQDDMDQFIKNAQNAQEEIKEAPTEEQSNPESQETNEELLQKLSMNKPSEDSFITPNNSENTTPNTNATANDEMEKIKKITERLFFSSDDGMKKMKEKEKEKNLR